VRIRFAGRIRIEETQPDRLYFLRHMWGAGTDGQGFTGSDGKMGNTDPVQTNSGCAGDLAHAGLVWTQMVGTQGGYMKDWLTNVMLQKFGPSAVRGGILGVVGWLAAKSGALAHWGVTIQGHIVSVDGDKVSMAVIAGLPALAAGLIKVVQHHATATILNTPQSGV